VGSTRNAVDVGGTVGGTRVAVAGPIVAVAVAAGRTVAVGGTIVAVDGRTVGSIRDGAAVATTGAVVATDGGMLTAPAGWGEAPPIRIEEAVGTTTVTRPRMTASMVRSGVGWGTMGGVWALAGVEHPPTTTTATNTTRTMPKHGDTRQSLRWAWAAPKAEDCGVITEVPDA
jgi:hypothetical protein